MTRFSTFWLHLKSFRLKYILLAHVWKAKKQLENTGLLWQVSAHFHLTSNLLESNAFCLYTTENSKNGSKTQVSWDTFQYLFDLNEMYFAYKRLKNEEQFKTQVSCERFQHIFTSSLKSFRRECILLVNNWKRKKRLRTHKSSFTLFSSFSLHFESFRTNCKKFQT